MAVVVQADPNNTRALMITGDSFNNTILVSQQAGRLHVMSAGKSIGTFDASSVDSIFASLGAGNDYFYAYSSGSNAVTIPVTVRAGDGDDTVYGGAGPDSLHGDAGNDTLLGGPGNDGLHGGTGADRLRGDAGFDRFLMVHADADTILDQTTSDVQIAYRGISGRTWSADEIAGTDKPLALLVAATGNNTLLKTPAGEGLKIYRGGSGYNSSTGNTSLGTSGGTGQLTLYNEHFTSHERQQLATVLHEVGHSFDDQQDFSASSSSQRRTAHASMLGSFRDVVGWTQTNGAGLKPASNGWYYRSDKMSEFVSTYARTSPLENFAETFANSVMRINKVSTSGVYSSTNGLTQTTIVTNWIASLR